MKKVEEKKHAEFSASSAERWLTCPGSIQLSREAPPRKENAYASEGTDAHSVLETLLKSYIDRKTYPFEVSANDEMMKHAQDALDVITEMAPEFSEILSETKYKLGFIHDDMGGTTDCAIVEPYGKLIVIDYKYGVMPVDPEKNAQMIAYALAIAHQYDYEFSSVELVIIQPRSLDAEDRGIVKKWTTTVGTLKEWAVQFEIAKNAALQPNPYFESGDHCKYCPAAVICPELKDKSLKEIQVEFDNETGALVLHETYDAIPNLGKWLTACDRLETWIGKLREHAFHTLESGGSVPGYKLVQKRSTRKWKDADRATKEAQTLWGKEAFTVPQLLSPAQLEKKDLPRMGDFIYLNVVSTSSGTTIAPESDPRPAFNFYESEFKQLDEEGDNEMATKKKAKKTAKKSTTKSK